jgi:adenosylhomocysteine nucleosidase
LNHERYLHAIGPLKAIHVMAADAEYGACLRARITPFICGVGPVEAAITLAALLARLDQTGNKPDMVISLGSAGSRHLTRGQVYQVASVSYRDMDASAFGFPKGQTPFLDQPPEITISHRIPGVEPARISTGANVVSGAAYDHIDADMVDMESWAVMRACQDAGVAMIGLRGISDGVDPVSSITDWTGYLHVVDEQLAAALENLQSEVINQGRNWLLA